MKPLLRLLVSLVIGLAVLGVYWFFSTHPSLAGSTAAEQKRVLNIVLFLACIPLIVFAVRLIDLVAFDVFVSRRGNVQTPQLLREIASMALYLMLFAWALSAIFQYNVTAFLATGTVLAAILGLALQDTLGNLFAGMALHAEDSFAPGDVIRSGEFIGVVEAVRWRGTRLRTFNNSHVVVPNSMLARERVEVFPRTNLNARVLQFPIDYSIPPAVVIALLEQAAANVEGVAHDIPAFARIGGLADSAATYEIKYHMRDYSQRDRIDADIRKAVWYALRRNGFAFPVPVRAVRRYEVPVLRQGATATEIADRLAGVDVLSPLSRAEHEAIAHAARVHVFSRGETIIRQNMAGDSMFVLHDGSVAIRIDDAEVARLGPGEFFGEMALLTGEKRAADVVALTDVVAVEIAKDALEPVVHDHPELVAAISSRVAERRHARDSAPTGAPRDEHQTILSRIREWFGL